MEKCYVNCVMHMQQPRKKNTILKYIQNKLQNTTLVLTSDKKKEKEKKSLKSYTHDPDKKNLKITSIFDPDKKK